MQYDEKIIILYKNGNIEYKDVDHFLPKNKKKLKKIEKFLFPLPGNSPIYIPVRPIDDLYAKRFCIGLVIDIINVDVEEEMITESNEDELYRHRVYDNPYEFIIELYSIVKYDSFNNIYFDNACTWDFLEVQLLNIPYCKIELYDGNHNQIHSSEKFNPAPRYEDFIYNGSDYILADILNLIWRWIPYINSSTLYTPKVKDSESISISTDSWIYQPNRKFLKSKYELTLITLESFNAYYLIDKNTYLNLYNIKDFRISVMTYPVDTDGFVDINIEDPSKEDTDRILVDIDEGNIDYYSIYDFYIRNLMDLLVYGSFIYDICAYMNYIINCVTMDLDMSGYSLVFVSGYKDTVIFNPKKTKELKFIHTLIDFAKKTNPPSDKK